jgi:hypothetical protein
MTQEPEDQQFSTFFRELRADDERSAPPLSRLLDSAKQRTLERRGHRRGLRVVAAVAAPVVTALLLIVSRTANFAPHEMTAAELLRWRSPTDGFLKLFGDELTSGVPRVGDSLQNITPDIKE